MAALETSFSAEALDFLDELPMSLNPMLFYARKGEPAERANAQAGSNQANLSGGRNGYSPNMLDPELRQARSS
jgi:hypothetical protein